jgi:L-ascorbate metabolism protein UlaG (beta-lactamase superfamily)
MAEDGTLEIAWYGQAMFTVSGADVTVVIDPVPPHVGYHYDQVEADVLLMTHEHHDHTYTDGVKGNPKVITAAGNFEAAGLKIKGTGSFHDDVEGRDRGLNVIFSWEQAGFKVAHFGDLGHRLSPELMSQFQGLDVAMVPVGGVFTIDGEQAAQMAVELKPRIFIPMHYLTPEIQIPLRPLKEFTRKVSGNVRVVSERPVTISRESRPVATEVWILSYQ